MSKQVAVSIKPCMLLGPGTRLERVSHNVRPCFRVCPLQALNQRHSIGYMSVETHKRASSVLAVSKGDDSSASSDAEKDAMSTVSSLKRISWISFWIQLGLSIASAGVLFFVISTTQKASMSSLFLAIGVATSFISTGLVRVVLSKARTISAAEDLLADFLNWDAESVLLRNTDVNLVGMASSIVALQGEVGVLVAKTLTSSSINPYTAQQTGPAAIDVFAVQGASNVLMAHFCSIFLITFLLRALQRFAKHAATV